MTTKKLTFRQKILVAGTLFGMFFGAGNLIFPVHLGQMAGRNAVVAMIGFIITAVGIPIFGVAAIGITHSDGLQTLSSKVGKGYGIFFTCLLYLTIGPLFAIPRCATVSFTTGITPLLGADSPEWLYLLEMCIRDRSRKRRKIRPSTAHIAASRGCEPLSPRRNSSK